MDLQQIRKQADRLLSEYRFAAKTAAGEAERLEQAAVDLASAADAQRVLQTTAQTIQQTAHDRIASVVSRCLEGVFGEDAYQLKVNFLQKRGKTEAELLLARDGYEVDPTDAAGGGVVDVTAFALRMTSLLLARPKRRRLFIADEPFKHLSEDYRPTARAVLLKLSKDLGFQIIQVTHAPSLSCGKVIELE